MLKLLLILLLGLVFESAGVVLLKKAMTEIGSPVGCTATEVLRVAKAAALNPRIWWGVFFEALFFLTLLILMSRSDISFLWPLTGLSFVFATFAATWFLGEQVSALRWAGVALIVAGAAVISYSEQIKPVKAPITEPIPSRSP